MSWYTYENPENGNRMSEKGLFKIRSNHGFDVDVEKESRDGEGTLSHSPWRVLKGMFNGSYVSKITKRRLRESGKRVFRVFVDLSDRGSNRTTMDVQTLEYLKNRYPTSSWALWSPEFPDEGCSEDNPEQLFDLISQQRKALRPSIVLLSLNPSTHLPSDFQNFHSTDPQHRNDKFRDYVVEANLEGAYMTDLVERVNPDSNSVEVTDDDVQNFLDQLELLGQDQYCVICFLNDAFTALRDTFDSKDRNYPHNIKGFSTVWNGTKLDCFKVYFHANWGMNQDKTPDEQLKYLNDQVIEARDANLSDWTG